MNADGTRDAAGFDVVVERGVIVPARDGTDLVTDLFRPAHGLDPLPGPFPVLLCRTKYTRERQHHEGMYFARHGYVVAIQDARQAHGEFDASQWRPRHESTDGYDAIEWLAAQAWSNGRIGAWGHSAMGQAIQAYLPLKPPNLRSVYIIDSGLNYGVYPARQNGTFGLAFRLRHGLAMAIQLSREEHIKALFRDVYRDPTKYLSILTRPHAPITKGTTVLALHPGLEQKYLNVATKADLDDDYWKDNGKSEEELINEWMDVAVCFSSGWYGNHLTANIEKYRTLKNRAGSIVRLIVGPWEHTMRSTFSGAVDFGRDVDEVDIFWKDRLRWFDETLKGIDTGLSEDGSVHYFVMGGGPGAKNEDGRLRHGGRWATSDEWPPTDAELVSYFLHGDGTLRTEPPACEQDSTTYTFDPRDPVPTVGGNFQEYSLPTYTWRVTWMPDGGAQDQRGNSAKPFCKDDLALSLRDDVLVFQTPPLEEDVEVSGELLARLWVSTSAPDTDFAVKLIDVHPSSPSYPEGFAMNLQDAIVRMRYRNGRRSADLIEPGEVYEIELPIHSTSNVFKRGHRIRLDVSSSNFPRIDVNLNNGGPLGVPGPVRTAENTVHHDRGRPSHIVLPVMS